MQIRYASNELTRLFDDGTTVADLIANRGLLGAIGAPTDVYAVSGGDVLDGSDYVSSFDMITLEKRGSSKA